jgi:hypothetical protein
MLRRRGAIGRAAHLLAFAALALNAFVVVPHIHWISAGTVAGIAASGEPDGAPSAPKPDCPIWMAHGAAGAALPAPAVALPPPVAETAAARRSPTEASVSRPPAPFAARAPPDSTV